MGLFRKSSDSGLEKMKKQKKIDPFVEEKIKAGVPIDHGWAWMCVLACHCMNMLLSGMARSQGIFYLELVNLFGSSSSETMWVFSIAGFCTNCVAPFSNSFAARFSSRQVVFVGAILVAFGFIMSNFATSLKIMYVTYGFFIGIGFGLVYAPTITTVGYYFHKRRALANGLSVSGSSVGAFFLPHLISFLIDHYSIKGAFIIMSAIMLHLCVSAVLLRPMEFYVERTKRLNQLKDASKPPRVKIEDNASTKFSQHGDACGDDETLNSGGFDEDEEFDDGPNAHEQIYGRFRVLPALQVPTLNTVPESNQEEEEARLHRLLPTPLPPILSVTPQLDEKKILKKFPAHMYAPRSNGGSQRWQSMNSIHSSSTALVSESLQGQNLLRTRSCGSVVMSVPGTTVENSELPTLFEAGLERRVSESDIGSAQTTLTHGGRTLPIFSESALQAVRKELVRLEQNKVLKRSRPTSHSFRRLLVPRLQHARAMFSMPSTSIVASVPDLTFASLQNLPQRWSVAYEPSRPRGLRDNILEFCKLRQKVTMGGKVRRGKGVPIIDSWILKQPSFYFLAISMAFCIIVFSTNFMMVPGYGESLGLSKSEKAAFIQYMGITDLIGRLTTGWVADLNLIPRKYLLIVFFISEGLICLLLPFIFCSYKGLVVFSLLLGLCAGSIVPLTAVVLCDVLGIRRLSSSFGMCMMIFGIASAIIPSVVAFLRDLTGSWDPAYYFCGSLCLVSAILLIAEIIVSKKYPVIDDATDSSQDSRQDIEKQDGNEAEDEDSDGSHRSDEENGTLI